MAEFILGSSSANVLWARGGSSRPAAHPRKEAAISPMRPEDRLIGSPGRFSQAAIHGR
jgi:hypothetical protein